jgi:ABC-type uncharacterized transport system
VERDVVNSVWFVGWLLALGGLLALGLRLPLQTRLSRWLGRLYVGAIVVAVLAVAGLANVALMRHDVHLDLTRERTFTPSRQAQDVVQDLTREVTLTYFYHARDENGRRAKHIVEVLGRRNPLLHVRTVDPDKQPRLAETYGVRLYNAAILEADGRRLQVMGTDETDIALGILKLLRRQPTTVCFMEGHGEYPFDNFEFHTHLEAAQAHSHGDKSSSVVKMAGHGAGRLRRALEALGLETRKIVPATESAIPKECSAVVAVNPRTTYLPAESDLLAGYLAQGGAALLMYDLGFVIEPRLRDLLAKLGVALPQEVVVDPLDHYSTDHETVAVPVYEPHPITARVALTFYPGVRPITLVPDVPRVTVTPLVRSSRESYTRAVTPVEAREPVRDSPPVSTSGKGPRVLAAAIEGTFAAASDPAPATKPFRVVIVGDGDFASNSFLPYMANSDLALSAVRWLTREDRDPKIKPSVPVPPLVLLTAGQMQRIFLVIEVLLPLGVVAVGAVVWWKRR